MKREVNRICRTWAAAAMECRSSLGNKIAEALATKNKNARISGKASRGLENDPALLMLASTKMNSLAKHRSPFWDA